MKKGKRHQNLIQTSKEIKWHQNKNISKTIPNGTILQTRDEYLHNESNYRKPGYANKGNYRKVAVVDSNCNDELAVVKLYSKSGKSLINTNSGTLYVSIFLDKDDLINPLAEFNSFTASLIFLTSKWET